MEARAAGVPRPRIFVLSAAAGAGKDSVLAGLRRRGVPIHVVVTYTTRPQRESEVAGVDYRFITREAFERLRDNDELLEHAEYAGHFYGTPKRPIVEALARGEDVILKIEVQGAATVTRKVPGVVLIFLSPESLEELERRLRERRTESPEQLQRRLAAAGRELARIPEYDYLVVNRRGYLEQAVDQLEHIIAAEHCRVNVPPIRL
ncbi:MAG: guanylate kinase [Chloroflexi bacterium]|nr:guanylate kinase [Chloroflexota bacterium]